MDHQRIEALGGKTVRAAFAGVGHRDDEGVSLEFVNPQQVTVLSRILAVQSIQRDS